MRAGSRVSWRFIEVKGRVSGAEAINVTRNELLYSLNERDDFILALVVFREDGSHNIRYLLAPSGKSLTSE